MNQIMCIMKKTILPILIFSMLMPALYSQITINENDMPFAGDTLRYSLTINPQQYDFLQTGEDFQWDFSDLKHQSQAIEEYELVSGINFLMGIIFGSDAIATSAFGDLPLDDFEIEVDGVYSVFSNETEHYTIDGFFVLLDGLGLPLKYSDPDVVYSFPLSFGDQDSTAFFGNTNLGDTLTLTRQGYRVNDVDGWGNIITPYGEFDVLRLKSTIYESDSIYWESFAEPVVLSRTITRYSWLAKDEKIPVLEVSYTVSEGSDDTPALRIKYRDIYREPSDEDPPVANFDANTTNAFTDEEILLFNYSTPSHDVNNYSWTFIPENVNFHNNTDATSTEPVVSFSEPGTYTVKLVAENEAGIDSLTRTDFFTIILPTGIDQYDESKIPHVYLSHQGNLLNITFKAVYGVVSVFDISGRLIFRTKEVFLNNFTQDFAQFGQGVYLVNIKVPGYENENHTIKIIKP